MTDLKNLERILKIISEYCRKIERCEDCPFKNDENHCRFSNPGDDNVPMYWFR